jgi:hypothetical protein
MTAEDAIRSKPILGSKEYIQHLPLCPQIDSGRDETPWLCSLLEAEKGDRTVRNVESGIDLMRVS